MSTITSHSKDAVPISQKFECKLKLRTLKIQPNKGSSAMRMTNKQFSAMMKTLEKTDLHQHLKSILCQNDPLLGRWLSLSVDTTTIPILSPTCRFACLSIWFHPHCRYNFMFWGSGKAVPRELGHFGMVSLRGRLVPKWVSDRETWSVFSFLFWLGYTKIINIRHVK